MSVCIEPEHHTHAFSCGGCGGLFHKHCQFRHMEDKYPVTGALMNSIRRFLFFQQKSHDARRVATSSGMGGGPSSSSCTTTTTTVINYLTDHNITSTPTTSASSPSDRLISLNVMMLFPLGGTNNFCNLVFSTSSRTSLTSKMTAWFTAELIMSVLTPLLTSLRLFVGLFLVQRKHV